MEALILGIISKVDCICIILKCQQKNVATTNEYIKIIITSSAWTKENSLMQEMFYRDIVVLLRKA